jgi:hypothetical protein
MTYRRIRPGFETEAMRVGSTLQTVLESPVSSPTRALVDAREPSEL